MTTDDSNQAKELEVLRQIIKGAVSITINSSRIGVIAPYELLDDPHFKVTIGLNLANPIPDLDIGPEGIRATLSFNRMPYKCAFPWPSVCLVVSDVTHMGRVWQQDAPPEMFQPVSERTPTPATGTDSAAPTERHTQMRPPAMPEPLRKPRPSWLKILKKDDES